MASSYQDKLVIEIPNIRQSVKCKRKLHKLARFHLSTLGICNAYLNIGHVVGMFFDWPDCFYSVGLGANRNVSGTLALKLAITMDDL